MKVEHVHNFLQSHKEVSAGEVRSLLSQHMLIDGFEIILDLKNSHGAYLRDAITGTEYLDFFTFFASNPLGMNHPKLENAEFQKKLLEAALHKPSNSDMYTVFMAEFVHNFSVIAKPAEMKYLFFIEGGAAAVENGLKVAFDWKVRKNFKKGLKSERGHKVIHFREAFHGRSGYTLSLTNTDPVKIDHFPKFDFPRISNPKIIFPVEAHLPEIIAAEAKALQEIKQAIADNPDDIALIIIEPIQCEGGDNYFRKEFFLQLRQIADENDILLMFDEVQTGMGMTGKMWAAQHYVMPDIISFGKKAQTCGIMVSDRIDDIEEHCFRKSSRINSTWGGNLADMVRSAKLLEIIYEDRLVENAATVGNYLLNGLLSIQNDFPDKISHARGLGLLCAFDLPSKAERNHFKDLLYEQKMLILGCGDRSIRFRPALCISMEEIDLGLEKIREALHLLNK